MTSLLRLAVADFVLRYKLIPKAHRAVAILSDFLIADISLSRACQLSPVGSLALLNLVWCRSSQAADTSAWSLAKLLQTEPLYFRWEFSRSMVQAVRRDDLSMLHWLLAHLTKCPINQDVIEEAARGGHLGILQLLGSDRSRGAIPWSESSMMEAAKGQHWGLAHWLYDRAHLALEKKQANTQLVQIAVDQNNFDQLKWAISKGFGVGNLRLSPCTAQDWRDRVEILRFIIQRDHDKEENNAWVALYQAAEQGDLLFIQWVVAHYVKRTKDLECVLGVCMNSASRSGHLYVVQWLVSYMDALDLSETMFEAAKCGRLEIVEWLYENYSSDPSVDLFQERERSSLGDEPTPSTTMNVAAANGHLDVLVYLQDAANASHKRRRGAKGKKTRRGRHQEVRCTSAAMDLAAANGHLSVVKWLHTNRSEGCTELAMNYAAANGHLEVVQWLHANREEGRTDEAIDGAAASPIAVAGSPSFTTANMLRER